MQVLAPGGEDLLVDELVPRVRGDGGAGEVVRGEGGQDADHHDVRADRLRPPVSLVQAVAQLSLQALGGVAGQRAGAHVDLDVELPELGLEHLAGDRVENLLVAHGRFLLRVDEVELDLHPGERALEVELRLVEHPAEHVQAAPQLLPVPLPIAAGEGPSRYLLAHDGSSLVPLCCEGGTDGTRRPGERERGRGRDDEVRGSGDEVTATGRWYSERLGQPIGVARWGHSGSPVLVFPTAGGNADEIEHNGLVGACWPLIESGRVTLWSCDSVAGRAMVGREGSPEHRM